jgi:hypothetical protein
MNEHAHWWLEAQRLEQEDRLKEAEEVVEAAMRAEGTPWPAQLAHLHYLRLERLLTEGRNDEAEQAAERALHWKGLHAAWATSGAEGAALSSELEQFRRQVEAALELRPSRPGT